MSNGVDFKKIALENRDLLNAALAREAELREELDNHDCATLLINAWVDAHGKQIPWDKAIEIIAVATKMPDAEKTRLLCLDDQYELLQQRLTVTEQRAAMLEREFKKLRDVAHGCYQIASSYSGCIDGVEEHGGDDHDDPSCAIFHRLYYAMFDADRALKPAAEGEGS